MNRLSTESTTVAFALVVLLFLGQCVCAWSWDEPDGAFHPEGERIKMPKGTMSQDQVDKFYKPNKVDIQTRYEGESMRVVTAENINFRLAKDRTVEKVGGFVAPEPLDAYFYRKFLEQKQFFEMKFNQFDTRLGRIEQLISDIRKSVSELKLKSEPSSEEVSF